MQQESENKTKSGCFVWSCRFSFIIIAFLGCMNMYSLRVNMSVAIVCMTESHNEGSKNTHKIDSANIFQENLTESKVNKTGLLSSLPYLGFWFVANITALIADSIQRRKCMSKTLTRKLLSGIGNILTAICIAIMANIAENPDLAVTLLTIGVDISGMQFGSGYLVNSVEVAPVYAGIIMAFSNSAGSLCGFLAPFVIGFIVEDGTEEQWRTVFYITAGIYIFGAIVFTAFGEVQTWALEDEFDVEIEVTNDREKKDIDTMENKSNPQIAVVSIQAKA